MKVKLTLLIISNLFFLFICPVFSALRLYGITDIIVKKATDNTEFIEEQLRRE